MATEHKIQKDDDRLRESLEAKAQVFNASIAANSIADHQGIINEVNASFLQLWGFSSKEEVVGKHISYFIQSQEMADEVIEALNTTGVWEGDFKAKKKDGSTFIAHSVATALRDVNGDIDGYQSSVINVSERQAIEDQLRISEEKYHRIFKNAPRLITLVYIDGTLKDCNDRIDILGYTKEEVIGKHIKMFFEEDVQDEALKSFSGIFDSGGVDDEIDSKMNQMMKKDGSKIDVKIKSTVTIDEDGRKHIICFIADITRQKEIEKALRESLLELQKSNTELEEFAYVASHDLQEPLRVIASYCQLLKENHFSCLNEDGQKYVNYSISSALRMRTLIKELLDYSRVGRKDEPFEHVNIGEIIQEVIAEYQIAIDDSNARIVIEDDMPVLFTVRFRVKQLISNLFSNALKFKSEKLPVIQIGVCKEEDAWLFYVKDNGIGIESQYFDRIFGIFKRLYSRDEYPGTGIGLALCKRIVEAHGGKIWVDSDGKTGTCIYFTIAKHIKFPEVISI